ncbi:MAG: lytic murein transglycosylase [Thermoleophilia bacterium]
MIEVPDMSRSQNDFDGSLEVIFDPAANRALLLDPETPVELRRGSRGRRFAFARAGLSVVAISGLCLLPTSSLADGVQQPEPVISATCEITDMLEDGTPSGVLDGGVVCVLPPGISPTPPDEPAEDPGQGPSQPAEGPGEPQAPAPPAEPGPAAAPPSTAATAQTAPLPAAPTATAVAPKARTSSAPRPAAASKTATAKQTSGAKKGEKATAKRPRASKRRTATKLRHRGTSRPKSSRTTTGVQRDVDVGALAGPLKPPFYVNDEAVIPRFLIKLYKQAGKRYDVPWPILAAINEIETDFGRNVAVSSAGATGWMQFMPATWKAYGVDADRNGKKDPNNPRDAIFAAARYLQASGAPKHMRRAIFAYNHAGWYVDSVLLRAERIAAQQGERSKTLWRLFETSGRRLEKQVLSDPRITLYECGREDIAAHRIDRRVLVLLRFLAWSGLHPTVSSLECGHGYYTKSGNVSHHSSGNAVDISAINGVPILGNQGSGSVTEATIRELLTLRGAMRADQIISLMTFERAGNTFAMSDHADHIHVGFAPLKPTPKVPSDWRFGLNRRITIDG